jgi:small-conductance mechanosensitive channel/CRP-like cAMP-binding protein
LDYTIQIALLGAVVFTALVINALAPDRKPKLKRLVLFAATHLTFFVLAQLLERGGLAKWTFRANLVADLFSAFAFLTAGVLLVVDVLLPRLGARLSTLTSDLSVGVGYIITIVSVLRGAGLNPTEAIATGAVVSAVLALSLQSTLGNILGGVALQLDGSIAVGDWIELENGRQGKVAQIRWRHTVLETRDFDCMIVPNATLLASSIIVLGKRGDDAAPHRMQVQFHVDHRYAPAVVVDVVTEALNAAPIDNVAASPAPNVVCADLAHAQRTSFALYVARYHIHDVAMDEPTSSIIRARIYAALKRAKIPLAMPATAVFLAKDDEHAAHRREEKSRKQKEEAIRSVSLFQALSDTEVHELARFLKYAPFSRGETMTRQGAVAHWLYVMTRGSAEVRTHIERTSETKVVSRLDAPQFFGEMGLLTGEPRLASVVALTEVECFRLEKRGFERILQQRPEIADAVSSVLAERRVELVALREGHAVSQRETREERERILHRIQNFFGLSE